MMHRIVQAVVRHITKAHACKERKGMARGQCGVQPNVNECHQGCGWQGREDQPQMIHGVLVVAAVKKKMKRDAPVGGGPSMEDEAMDKIL
eukprot:CAMPEP_0119110484 /NCGR_PEP_ID=MMETSP1180-20130426/30055_1 /TAXON_ID=3052 ORGANISM="Chlamydomonas cf sp, Strain CCMP681" /NCGR_SAMPLE_ID=MMETSP1180 /ASSEMBLY_ACC=CAM_ASM_000741 /LENGTH=89 /DNA_ID=CAMNT_0007096847 /DNA_START=307 /DNA_END=576 /DNA_ORIENTATION=+